MAERSAPIVPSSGFAAWLTALSAGAMSFLAVLALATGLSAGRLADQWQGALDGVATVRLTGAPDTLDVRVEQAMEVLRETPGIASARPLDKAELAALLKPWLGRDEVLDGLPLPRLIEVRIEPPGPDVEALRSRLDLASDGAIWDDHDAWRQPLAHSAAGLSALAWTAMALVILAAAAMVALAARASLARHTQIVRVLRLIGAEDGFIARAFTQRLAARAGLGGLVGAGLGLAALAALPEIGIDAALKPALLPGPMGWLAILLAVPATAALIAWATARQAVARELARML